MGYSIKMKDTFVHSSVSLTWVLATAVTAVLAAGCKDDEIHAYRAPKDPPIATHDHETVVPPDTDTPRPHVQWTVPAGWGPLPEQRPMRVATFEAGSGHDRVEISVSAFPGDVGGLLANINRWRGQLDLDPIADHQLDEHVIALTTDGPSGVIVDMTGPADDRGGQPANRMVAVIMDDTSGKTWFIKAMAASPIIAQHKESMLQFARSFRIGDQTQGHEHDLPTRQPQAESGPTWEIPQHWRPDPNAPSIALAAFSVVNDTNGQAKVTVTALPGDGGGTMANINRWRGQVGLGPVDTLTDLPQKQLQIGQLNAAVFDMVAPTGTPASRPRIRVAILHQPHRTWFFKMTGSDKVIQDQKEGFDRFVRSVRFGGMTR